MIIFPDLRATLQPNQWILRLHPDYLNNPDSFFGSASVSMDVRHVASIRGLVTPYYSEEISREIKRALAADIEASDVIWERRRLGRRYAGASSTGGRSDLT